MTKSRSTLGILAAVVLVSSARATINFNLIGLSTIAPLAAAGFQQAANRWSNTLDVTNGAGNSINITINLQVGFSSLGTTTLGQSAASTRLVTYSAFKSALSGVATSPDDAAAVASLPSGNTFGVYLNRTLNDPSGAGSAVPYVDNSTDLTLSHVTNSVRATYANLRALGLKPAVDSAVDAQIIFSSDFPFDFNPADGIDAGKTDFVGVATHEIGHALGFGSGSTDLDYMVGHGNVIQDQDVLRARPLDFFRYSTASHDASAIDLSADTRGKFLSLDRGATSIASFSTGQYFGDGFQASHWLEQTPSLGLMDPGIAPGEKAVISALDRRAFDLIGYKVISVGKWTDTSSSSTARWSNAAQWSVDGIPDNTISAVFANNANYVVSVDTVSAAKDITVANDNVTLNLTSSNLSSGTVNLGQALGDNSVLNVQRVSAGQFNTGNVNVGAVSGSSGTLCVQNGGVISTSGTIAIAPVANSVGTLSVISGNVIATGDLTVGGTSTAAGGTGAVSVKSGGTVSVGGNLKIWTSSATVAGGTLTVGGATTVAVGGSFVQSSGTSSLGNISGAGSLVVSGGIINATQVSAATVSLTSTGKILMHANGGNAGMSRVSSLSITGGAQFDLNDNDLIVDYAGASPAATIRGYLTSGFNSGYWNGAGISSLAAAADVNQTKALGYADASAVGLATFDGQSVGNAVLVKYTYYGDSNLDGVVNVADFQRFLDGLATGGSTWAQGDYTYDGRVDLGNDFNLFLSGYMSQGAALGDLAGVVEQDEMLSASQKLQLLSAVPEPVNAGVMVIAVGAVAGRRRLSRRGRKAGR